MKQKKIFTFSAACVGVVVAFAAVGIKNSVKQNISRLEADGTYTLTFNNSTNVLGNGEGTVDVQTVSGYDIEFNYSRVYTLEGHWQKMIYNGYLFNSEPISGMTSLTMNFTGTAPTITYGFDVEGQCVYNIERTAVLVSGTPFAFDGETPDYFKLSLANDSGLADLDIVSMSITYSCTRSVSNNLRNIAVYDSTPVNGGESDSSANKGKIYYWYGEGASISNAAISAGTFSFDYTTGNQWYSKQVFYTLPYSSAYDETHILTTITCDQNGNITLNGTVYELEANTPRTINIDTYVGQGGQATTALSVQLGVSSGNVKLAAGHFSMTLPKIYSRSAMYYDVTFMNGLSLVHSEAVRDGKTMNSIPAGPAPESGYIFKGWYHNEDKLISSTVIISSITYNATFISEALADKYTVTFINSANHLETYTEQVVETLSPTGSTIVYPFSYSEYKFFADAGLTEEVQLGNLSIEADTELYYLAKVTYLSGYDAWATIESNVSWNASGELIFHRNCSHYGNKGESWHIQLSFGFLPNDPSLVYTITFEYDIAVAGAYYTIFNDGAGTTHGVGDISDGSNQTLAVVYNGADMPANTRFQFGFGDMDNGNDINFVLHSVTISSVAA